MNIYTSLKQLPDNMPEVALAIGLFDGIHQGHKTVIREAKRWAEQHELETAVLTFRITNENFPVEKDVDKRITSTSLFYRQLKNMGVSIVFSPTFEEVRNYSPENFVTNILSKELNSKFVSCGEDFRFGKNAMGTAQQLISLGAAQGIAVKAVPLVTYKEQAISSTLIRTLLEEGQVQLANQMLGHPYALDFKVIHGRQLGRTIGKPTINQPYPPGYVIPKFGAYASLTFVDEKLYTSVTNIGIKPTVGSDVVLAETYIQNYDGDLYGQNVQVSLLKFLREEMKFSSIQELRQQIAKDSEAAAALGTEYLHSEHF